jgi:hypothetical protein
MHRYRWLSICAIVLSFATVLIRHAAADNPTTLSLDILSPSPIITDTDTIELRGLTPVDVFPDTGHYIINVLFEQHGDNLTWDIGSGDDDSGIVQPITEPIGSILDFGPLVQ